MGAGIAEIVNYMKSLGWRESVTKKGEPCVGHDDLYDTYPSWEITIKACVRERLS
jgi:hypothetical protein